MFRRKEDGTEEVMEDNAAGSEGAKLVTAPGVAPTAPVNPTGAAPASPSSGYRPVPPQAAMVAASRSSLSSTTAEPSRPAAAAAGLGKATKRVLTVGPDIQMKGEITSCDRVVIEGMVDASMRDVHTVELTESGVLKGTAEVEDAEISGNFEGDLTVRGKLTIHTSGRVRGNITYGEIEIERGGQISGNVRNATEAKSGGNNKRAA